MKIEDMILSSADDHIIEPPDLFERHLPAHLLSEAPKVVVDEGGIERWIFQGQVMGPGGLNAVVTWPKDEWDVDPVGYAEMRRGCYNVHDRIDDMNANGMLTSLNFPTFPGFAGAHLMRAPNRELSMMIVQAYNDWHYDEWCAAYPERLIPLAILPLWDVEDAVKEVQRCAAKGFTAVTFPEVPYAIGLPSFYTDYWDPVLRAIADNDLAMCLHIGAAFQLLRRPEEAPLDQRIIMSPQLSAVACMDLIMGGVFKRVPNLRVAMSEGGIGWVPAMLDRMEFTIKNQEWLGSDIGPKSPTELFRDNFLGCFISGPSSLLLRDRIGIESIAWECDYPHSDSTWPASPELVHAEFEAAGMSDHEINLVGYENSHRFFRFDPFATIAREDATIGALRAKAADVDVSTTSRAEYRRRFTGASSS